MIKKFIKNRKDQKVAVVIEKSNPQKGLVFVMHGLGGYKEQVHIQAIAEAFKDGGYAIIRFDTTCTLGESDGDFADATTTSYYEDLEDVIKWASSQDWYQEPFVMAGHSLGGMCMALFAENFPNQVKALAPISTVVSGNLSVEAYKKYNFENYEKWKKTGWLEEESNSKPGLIKKLKWSHMIDRLKYDLLPNAGKLIMPKLLIVGEKDNFEPLETQKILFEALSKSKKLHIIKGAPHTFRSPEHLAEIKQIFNNWIKSLE